MKTVIYLEGIFKSKWLSKFINCLVVKGQKFKLEKLVYSVFFYLKYFFTIYSFFFFFESLELLKPWVGLKLNPVVKSKKQSIQAYPVILSTNVQYKKSIYWLVKSIQLRKELCFVKKMANEAKNIVFKEVTQSMKKKKEYYNHAILFKSVRKFKW